MPQYPKNGTDFDPYQFLTDRELWSPFSPYRVLYWRGGTPIYLKQTQRSAYIWEKNLDDGLPSLIGGKRDFLSGGEEVASVASNANSNLPPKQSLSLFE